MPKFGHHETGQRLHLSGVGAIYVLGSDPKKIIKALQPPAGIWSDEQLHLEIQGFLARAKTQKTLSRASENWAPILETAVIHANTEDSTSDAEATKAVQDDSTATGGYLIMNRYERSVQSLLDGRVNMHNPDLRVMMGGILKGLRDIRSVAKRPHGALKASNILLLNSTDLTQATVHLSDPAPERIVNPNSDKKDYGDLAKILYELVTLRAYPGGPVPKSKDWSELGPNGEDWRKLCNTLLDIGSGGGTAEEKDFDKMIAAVDTWRAKPRRSKIPMIAAGVLLLLAAGGFGAWYFTRPPKLDFNQANWEKLCLQYDTWFGDFAAMDDAAKKKMSAAPYPAEVVKILDEAGRDLQRYQPQNIGMPKSSLDLAKNPPDSAKTGYGPYYTKQGDELIDKVADALTPAHWPLLTSLDKTAATYEQRGWMKPAAGIRGIIAAAKPPVVPASPVDIDERIKAIHKADMFANIDSTIRAANSVNDIEKRWASIQDLIKTLPKTEVPLLQAFPKFAEEFPRSGDPAAAGGGAVNEGTIADVQALAQSFAKIEEVVTQLSTDLNRKEAPIDFAELAKDPDVQLPADGKLKIEDYTGLPKTAHDYIKLQVDPRAELPWTKNLEELQKDLIDPIQEANPQDPHLAELNKLKTDIQGNVTAFNRLSPIIRNRTRILTLTAYAKDDLEKLKTEGEKYVAPYIIDPPKYIAQQRERLTNGVLAKATPAVYAEWKKHHQALLDKVAAAPQELKKYRTFQTTDEKFGKLQNIYVDFDNKMIPPKVAGLSDFPTGGGAGAAWKSAIAAKVATVYREQAIMDLMTNPALKWADDLPLVDDPGYQSYAKNRVAAYEQLRGETLALIEDFSTIQTRLDRLDLLPGEPAKGAASWRDLAAKWKNGKSPLPADVDIAAALKPITDRAAALAALDTVADYKTLAADAMSPSPEISLTAWRKIDQAPLSEGLPVLDDEEKSQSHVGELVAAKVKAGVVNAGRANGITAEMAAERPIRWHKYVATVRSGDVLEKSLDRAGTFGVTLSPQADAALVYDAALYDLRKKFAGSPKEADLKILAQKFIDSVKTMPDAVSKDKGIEDLLARMAKPLAPGQDVVSTAGAGPKLAGWEQESPNPDVRIFYLPSKAAPRQILEFTRIQAGNKTVFMGTSEVSFGLFAGVANAHFADLDNKGKAGNQAHWFNGSQELWDGPRVWKVSGGQFVLNDDWLNKNPQLGNVSPYPAAATPAKPAESDPMQQLTPWSAMYVARELGCRLPTSEEWKATYDKFEANVAGPKDAWNLRGAGWLQQQQYSKGLAAKGATYPDNGIFLRSDQLFAGINAESAIEWKPAELMKLAPNRISGGASYPDSQIWFRKVASEPGLSAPGAGTGRPHDLVGNVAEYVFDGSNANAVIKDNAARTTDVDAAIGSNERKNVFVIGGSSLSPPQIPFNEKQPLADVNQVETGFSDVGFRLAYTAPIDSIADVLAAVFRAPPYLPAGPAPR